MSVNLQAEYADALRVVLDEMGTTATQLIDILDREREALQCADAEALNRAGESKQILLQQLEQLDAERLHLSRTSAEAAHQTENRWRELLKALTVCRDKNQRNGALVGLRLNLVRRALSVLTGNDAQANGTYGQNGTVKDMHRTAPLARA